MPSQTRDIALVGAGPIGVVGAAPGHALFIETCRDHPRRILADLQAGSA